MDITTLTYDQLIERREAIKETITNEIMEMSSEEFLQRCQDVDVISNQIEAIEDIAISTWADARRENKFNQSL